MKIITPVKASLPIVEGKQYYYLSPSKATPISEGTAVKCDKCGKWCTANSVGIVDFPAGVTTVPVQTEITEDELSYDENTESCLCSDCN